MNIQQVKLTDIVDFRPRELSNDEWSQLSASREGMELRSLLDRAQVPGGWAGIRNKILLEAAGGLLDIRLLDVMRSA
jgi:hypothetical protein